MRKKIAKTGNGKQHTPCSASIEALARDLSEVLGHLVDADELKDSKEAAHNAFDSAVSINLYAYDCLVQQRRRINALYGLATLTRPRNLRELLILQNIAAYFRGLDAAAHGLPQVEYDVMCEDFDKLITTALHELSGVTREDLESAGMRMLGNHYIPPQYVPVSLKALHETIERN